MEGFLIISGIGIVLYLIHEISAMLAVDYKYTLSYILYKELSPHFKTYKTMKFNIKAFKYAMQYVAYPTLFFCLLVFLWFLDAKVMYDWITNKSGFPALCRIIIFFIEIFVFYKAYVNRIEEINKEEILKSLDPDKQDLLFKDNKIDFSSAYTILSKAPIFADRYSLKIDSYDVKVYDKSVDKDEAYYLVNIKRNYKS